jgi:hypothetical protein
MMKNLHLIVAAAALLFPVNSRSDEAPVVVTVSLPYSTILPGVPFDIDVTLKNVSAQPATAGLIAHLIVTLPDGTEIRPEDQTVLDPHLISGPETSIVIAPGQTVERVVTWSRSSMPGWSSDPRFSGVGTYDIALELTDPESSKSVRSSTARLVRTVAPGDDQELWTRMQAISDGRWSDDGFIRIGAARELLAEILNAHSSSGYYPYALLLKVTALQDDVEPSLEAAQRFTDSPAFAHLLLQAADSAYGAAISADVRHDPGTAARFYQRAAELYAKTLEAKSLAVRGIASQRKHVAADLAEKYRGRSR